MIDHKREHFNVVVHKNGKTRVTLIEYPGPEDWMEVKRRALITSNMTPVNPPTSEWIERMLDARHSPIRRAMYSFLYEDIPSNTATHFARHVHAQPYVGSLRTDRITEDYMQKLMVDFGQFTDPDHAPRMTPVGMILDVNAEEIQEMANKRLCVQAATITRSIMQTMAGLVFAVTPQMRRLLVPRCEYCGGLCHEYKPCGKYPPYIKRRITE